jgi:type III secretion protein SpaR/YscT/HrcT
MFGLSEDTWPVLILGFARLYGFMYFFPLISSDQVPAMVRTMLCIGLTPYVAMPQLVGAPLDRQAMDMFYLLLGKEALVGAFLGLLVGLPLRLPEVIGNMIDNQRGSAVTDTYNPTSGSDASLLGQLLSLTMVVYFLSSGGFDQIVALLAGSFGVVPMDGYVIRTGESAWSLMLEFFLRYLSVFIILTLPVMAVMFLAEISLAVASRFAQSLNVFSLAQPIKALVAISMLITLMPKINREVTRYIQDMLDRFGG